MYLYIIRYYLLYVKYKSKFFAGIEPIEIVKCAFCLDRTPLYTYNDIK